MAIDDIVAAAGVAKGTASKALAALEARIGAPLFHRTSRQLVPTVTGERLIAHARALRSVLDAASEAAWRAAPFIVGVTNEVGWGLVSEHRSGRIFADRLGWLNQRIASASDRVDLVVSGQVLTIKEPA